MHNTGIAQAVSPLASASLRRSQALLLEAVGCPKALRNSALSCGTPMVASTLQASAQVIQYSGRLGPQLWHSHAWRRSSCQLVASRPWALLGEAAACLAAFWSRKAMVLRV